jgi:hypothetical protein
MTIDYLLACSVPVRAFQKNALRRHYERIISQSSIVNSVLLSCPYKYPSRLHFHVICGFITAAHPAARRPWRDCTESPLTGLAHHGILTTIPARAQICKGNFQMRHRLHELCWSHSDPARLRFPILSRLK